MAIDKKTVALSPVLFRNETIYVTDPITGQKALRQERVNTLQVEALGLTFDAGEVSMDRMDRVVSVAVWRVVKTLADSDPAIKAVYDAVLKQPIRWKTADNLVRDDVTIEQLATAQEKALYEMSEIYGEFG